MKTTRFKPDLDSLFRMAIVGDPKATLLVANVPGKSNGEKIVAGALVPLCPCCGRCRTVFVTIVTDDMEALAVIECVSCRASTTILEMLGAWDHGRWDGMFPRTKRSR